MHKVVFGLVIGTLSVSSFSQDRPEMMVKELKALSSEAHKLVDDFEKQGALTKVAEGAPDYKIIQAKMHEILKAKTTELDSSLVKFNERLKVVYEEKRDLSYIADNLKPEYQKSLTSFIFGELKKSQLEKQCLTLACSNQITEDLKNWYAHSKELNKNLKLPGATIKKAKSKDVKKGIEEMQYASGSGKPEVLSVDSRAYKNLKNDKLNSGKFTQGLTVAEISKMSDRQVEIVTDPRLNDFVRSSLGITRLMNLSDQERNNLTNLDLLDYLKDAKTINEVSSLTKDQVKILTDSRLTSEMKSAILSEFTIAKISEFTEKDLNRLSDPKVNPKMKKEFSWKEILALSDADFDLLTGSRLNPYLYKTYKLKEFLGLSERSIENLSDPLIGPSENFLSLSDLMFLGLRGAKEKYNPCYETEKITSMEFKQKKKHDLKASKVLELNNGGLAAISKESLYLIENDGQSRIKFDRDIKEVVQLKNGTIVVLTINGLNFLSQDGKPKANFTMPRQVKNLLATKEGALVAVKEDGTVFFFSHDGSEKSRYSTDHKNLTVAQSGDGSIVLVSKKGELDYFNTAGKLIKSTRGVNPDEIGPIAISVGLKDLAMDGSSRYNIPEFYAKLSGDLFSRFFIGTLSIMKKDENGLKDIIKREVDLRIEGLLSLKNDNIIAKNDNGLQIYDSKLNKLGEMRSSINGMPILLKDGTLALSTDDGIKIMSINSGKQIEAVNKAKCSNEQIDDPALPRTRPAGASKQ